MEVTFIDDPDYLKRPIKVYKVKDMLETLENHLPNVTSNVMRAVMLKRIADLKIKLAQNHKRVRKL